MVIYKTHHDSLKVAILWQLVIGAFCVFISSISVVDLTKAPDIQGSPPSLVGGLPVGGGITPQSAFFYRNVWIPLVVNITGPLGSQKPVL